MDISNHWFAGIAMPAVLSGCSRDDAATTTSSSAPLAKVAPTARVVHVYTWADNIDDKLETKLLTGGSGYDIAVVASDKLGRLVSAGVLRARVRARESGKDDDFRYVIPREGTIRWVDTFTIPTDAPHPAEAHAFIDFVMQPEVAARAENRVWTRFRTGH